MNPLLKTKEEASITTGVCGLRHTPRKRGIYVPHCFMSYEIAFSYKYGSQFSISKQIMLRKKKRERMKEKTDGSQYIVVP